MSFLVSFFFLVALNLSSDSSPLPAGVVLAEAALEPAREPILDGTAEVAVEAPGVAAGVPSSKASSTRPTFPMWVRRPPSTFQI